MGGPGIIQPHTRQYVKNVSKVLEVYAQITGKNCMLPKLAYRLEPKAEKDDVTHLVTSHCFVTSMTQGPTTQIEL